MKKILFILVLVFSLFFVVYGLDQIDVSLYESWGILLAWLAFMKVLEKTLSAKKDNEEEDDDYEEDEEEDDDEEEGDDYEEEARERF
jgi:hypothetical protein